MTPPAEHLHIRVPLATKAAVRAVMDGQVGGASAPLAMAAALPKPATAPSPPQRRAKVQLVKHRVTPSARAEPRYEQRAYNQDERHNDDRPEHPAMPQHAPQADQQPDVAEVNVGESHG